jgi:hypothetical protein
MSADDQAHYGAVPDTALRASHPQPSSLKTGTAERKEQADFSRWLLLQNSNGADISFEWHPLHAKSKNDSRLF